MCFYKYHLYFNHILLISILILLILYSKTKNCSNSSKLQFDKQEKDIGLVQCLSIVLYDSNNNHLYHLNQFHTYRHNVQYHKSNFLSPDDYLAKNMPY